MMKNNVTLQFLAITLVFLFPKYAYCIDNHLNNMDEEGTYEDEVKFMCTSEGVRYYIEHEDYWDSYATEIKGEDGSIINLAIPMKFMGVDGGKLIMAYPGRRLQIPSDSICYINDYFFAAKNEIPVKSSKYIYQHDAPTEDENSLEADVEIYADFPTEISVANSHMRYWMSSQIYRNMSYLIESLHYNDEDGEPFGCYMANNDIDPEKMLNYYGELFKNMYKKYIHHTVEVSDGGGLSMYQNFFLQAVFPHYLTYLYEDMQITIGAAHGGHDFEYISFDRNTGQPVKASDLFRPESMHQLKSLLLNAIYKDFNGRHGVEYKDLHSFLVESDVISFLGCDENTPIEEVIDNVPVETNVALLKEGVIFTYLPYEIASYGAGQTWVILTYDEIKDFMKPYHMSESMPGGNLEITHDDISNLRHQSRKMLEQGKWDEAVNLGEHALSCIEKLVGKDDLAYDFMTFQLFELYVETKKTEKAEMLIRQMKERISHFDDYAEAPYMDYQLDSKMAQLYVSTKKYDEAIKLMEPYSGHEKELA